MVDSLSTTVYDAFVMKEVGMSTESAGATPLKTQPPQLQAYSPDLRKPRVIDAFVSKTHCPCTHGASVHVSHGGCEGLGDDGLPCECQAVS